MTTNHKIGPSRVLTFKLGSETFAIDGSRAREVLGAEIVTRPVKPTAELHGMLQVRGETVPVIDLRKKLGLPADATRKVGTGGVVVVRVIVGGRRFHVGLMADEVGKMASIDPRDATKVGTRWRSDAVLGVVKSDTRNLVLLDVDRLATGQELAAIGAATAAERPRPTAASTTPSGTLPMLVPRGDGPTVSTGGALLTEQQFLHFATFIEQALGIKMPLSKLPFLQSRLQRRIRELKLPDVGTYHDRFFGDPILQAQERTHLIDLATTNKTDFLREPAHFDYLVQRILPEWQKRAAGQPFRIWSAGCATGEEPYTLAMVLYESLGSTEFEIFATDVSQRALATASRGVYSDDRIDPVPEEWRQRHILRSRDADERLVRMGNHLRTRITFQHLNFQATDYGRIQPVDVVFFRNVLIYFDHATQQAVVAHVCQYLKPGGYLFISHTETLHSHALPLKVVGPSIYKYMG